MKKEKYKPCPCCGKRGEWISDIWDSVARGFRIRCKWCGLETGSKASVKGAREMWNWRLKPEPIEQIGPDDKSWW